MLNLLVITCLALVCYVSALENSTEYDSNENLVENPKFNGRIVGGFLADIADVSYQASIQVKGRNEYHHFCGGSVITSRLVLSAAHCFVE